MTTLLIVLGIVLLVMALFLIAAILLQHGKSANLSGTIAGGAETFFGKNRGSAIDKVLGRVTTVVAVVFVLLVLLVYVLQPDYNLVAPDVSGSDISGVHGGLVNPNEETTAVTDTTEPETPEADGDVTEPEA